MTKNIIDTIVNTLVADFGMKVIATTHSPTTVALAPDDSIHTMEAGTPGLRKVSKSTALNILTVGVPTLSIAYDGRRQVFVESPADVEIYFRLYQILRSSIKSGRSLEFIATGQKGITGTDTNTGCETLKHLVTTLTNAGNISVFGLIDWDGRHVSTSRIAVLAENARNGIENVILDPLLLALMIYRAFPEHRDELNMQNRISYFELLDLDKDELQQISDRVSAKIFGSPAIERVPSKYTNGIEIQIDSRCAEMDDHIYERKILDAFPFLKSFTKGQAGKLMSKVVLHVLVDSPAFIPISIREAIEDLLERPSH